MSEPDWVTVDDVVYLNKLIVEAGPHDEPHGVSDFGSLESAVNRPRQHYNWAEDGSGDDLVLLGSKLCIGISESQAFIQGNKRTGFAAMEMFFNRNGHTIDSAAHGLLADIILGSAHPDKSQRLDDGDFALAIDSFVVEGTALTEQGLSAAVQGVSIALGEAYGLATIDTVVWKSLDDRFFASVVRKPEDEN